MRTATLLLVLLAIGTCPAFAASVQLGSEVLAARGFKELQGSRVGLIANQTSVDRRGESTIDVLRKAKGVRLVALFAPEHGLAGDVPAGKEFTNAIHRPSGLPVFSLYGPGPTRKPTPAMLKGLDVLVYDVQDTGYRPYTYISTLGLAMEACAEAGVRFVVLDRPNPLGGLRIEGPVMKPAFRSFVSQWPVPLIYGLTAGELARMINGEGWIKSRCQLSVVPLSGWKRTMTWRDTGLPWTRTSPNVRAVDTAFHMPATGLLGDIGGVSIGMGTDTPFRYIAASWLDGPQLADRLNRGGLKGLRFEPVSFRPVRGAYANQTVNGVAIRVTDPARAPLIAVNFHALEAIRKAGGRDLFAEAVKRQKSFSLFDKLMGTDATRKALEAGKSAPAIVAAWKPDEEAFRRRREKYLLYR